MLSVDEVYLFQRELGRLEEEKQSKELEEKYKVFLDEQIDLLQSILDEYMR
ncbi:hypothetical protein JCM19046_1849 [Bacillus sp. JCM 19046]|uniref:Uncharacterized metal-binding protein YceD (DUF177 family) n=1 Tax=Shouchella xiaoxiensis TaxID=766895 RepID=A0ABS2SU02_9BACI|nr:hypothetical protein [Shouchella xiaoxiensis]MBM7839014.1 uncharacterized metal-binding protein YceD (DUF177 family) [Shouchella xiaoxiensis]GAF13553.1 hypothetical protein JCM19045_2804 [Bacillus sp. JCM 19045]GAF17340.1 hypothetical protein JCM19046_1849 [Bacillus sp. JCM 19046]